MNRRNFLTKLSCFNSDNNNKLKLKKNKKQSKITEI